MAALNLREVLAPESRQGFDGYLQALRETGATHGLGRIVTAAGERRTWSFNSSVRVDPAAGGPLVRMIAQDVTERFQSLALRKAIFAEVREPLLATSAEGRVVLHNTAAAELFGQDLDSQPLIKALLPLMEDNPPSAINDHLLWHGALAGSGGRQIEVEVSRTVFKQSLPIRAVYVVHDISRHVEAGRERERLLHNVAHELRGPMAVLGNALSLVAESYGDMAAGELDRMLGSATRMAQRLHLLLEDMLSAGSIQAGRFGVAPQPMGLRELIDTALDNLELRLDVTGQRIECHLPDVEAVVLADPIYAVRALSNLLSNACKYSPQGSAIGILAELAGGEARISVVDRGPGIPPDQQAGIFDRYYRAQPNERQPGIGLGLAIVKVIVEAHGGTIGFNSSPGAGSTFWFTLPLQEAAFRAEPAAPVGA